MSDTSNKDPLGYIDELRTAIVEVAACNDSSGYVGKLARALGELPLAATQLPPDSDALAQWATAAELATTNRELCGYAFVALVAIGYCRLYGIGLPSAAEQVLAQPMPPALLVPAIHAALNLLQAATAHAHELPARFDDAEPLEDMHVCTSGLHSRMETWAMLVAIDDAYQCYLNCRRADQAVFADWLQQLRAADDAFTAALQQPEQMRLLSVATELPLLENWRKMLAGEYRELLPWWLDGTLEQIAADMGGQIDKLAVECRLAHHQQKRSNEDSVTA